MDRNTLRHSNKLNIQWEPEPSPETDFTSHYSADVSAKPENKFSQTISVESSYWTIVFMVNFTVIVIFIWSPFDLTVPHNGFLIIL